MITGVVFILIFVAINFFLDVFGDELNPLFYILMLLIAMAFIFLLLRNLMSKPSLQISIAKKQRYRNIKSLKLFKTSQSLMSLILGLMKIKMMVKLRQKTENLFEKK